MSWSRNAVLLLAVGFLTLFLGGWYGAGPLEATGLLLLCAIFGEWIFFRFQIDRAPRVLRLRRDFEGLPRGMAWQGQEFRVRLALADEGAWAFPHLVAREIVPPQVAASAAEGEWHLCVDAGSSAEWSYSATAERIGHASFPGLSLTCISPSGFFSAAVFLESPSVLRIYPRGAARRKLPGFAKTANRYRQLGVHRHRRPGTGLELLELRDYVPGDPPQRIAWKASARRESLVARDFESEVPVRTTVFLDASAAMRVGENRRTLLDDAVPATAEFARLALANGDHVGLTMVSEETESILLPGRGRTRLLRLLDLLTSRSNLSPGHMVGDLSGVFEAVDRYARVRHPRLWDRSVNRDPIPFLSLRPFSRLRRRRKQLSAVICAALGEGPATLARATESDDAFGRLLVRYAEAESLWLGRESLEEMPSICEASAPKLAVLERALRFTLRRAKDNEFYVVYSNLAFLEDRLDSLVSTLRLAQARHHRVLVLQPPVPGGLAGTSVAVPSPFSLSPADWVRYRAAESIEAVRRRFLQAGIPLECLPGGDAVPFLLMQVDRLRYSHAVPA